MGTPDWSLPFRGKGPLNRAGGNRRRERKQKVSKRTAAWACALRCLAARCAGDPGALPAAAESFPRGSLRGVSRLCGTAKNCEGVASAPPPAVRGAHTHTHTAGWHTPPDNSETGGGGAPAALSGLRVFSLAVPAHSPQCARQSLKWRRTRRARPMPEPAQVRRHPIGSGGMFTGAAPRRTKKRACCCTSGSSTTKLRRERYSRAPPFPCSRACRQGAGWSQRHHPAFSSRLAAA